MNYDVAYIQVKDLTKNQDEKVFIFNGWTFSNDSSVRPFDHAVYDLQLVKCEKCLIKFFFTKPISIKIRINKFFVI